MFGVMLGTLMMLSGEPTGVLTPSEKVDMIEHEMHWQPKREVSKPYTGLRDKDGDTNDVGDILNIYLGDTTLLIAASVLAEYKDLVVSSDDSQILEKKLFGLSFEGVSWNEAIEILGTRSGVSLRPDIGEQRLLIQTRALGQ